MYAARLPAISTPRKSCYALAARIGKPASRWIDVVQSGRSLKGSLYARFFGAALRFRPQPGIDVGLDPRGEDLISVTQHRKGSRIRDLFSKVKTGVAPLNPG